METLVIYVLVGAILLFFIALAHFLYHYIALRHSLGLSRVQSLLLEHIRKIVADKKQEEQLLSRVLPPSVIHQLKETGRVGRQRYGMVTVLFADIEGFTRISQSTYPDELIDLLDRFFFDLDGIIQQHHIEKIKTIGDAYMCAGGIPNRNRTNPVEVVLAALAMQQRIATLQRRVPEGSGRWALRIGINTGQVIAGVLGYDKLSYDIWGSTVNIASRIESSSQPGRINISSQTHLHIREFFDCTPRGYLPVKNAGQVDMYLVDRIKPELSADAEGFVPNDTFRVRLQLLRLLDLEDYVLTTLERRLPQNLYYHNLKHTIDVYTQVELIGLAEGVSPEELLLLRTAALFHDMGHIIDYRRHEEISVQFAYEILPDYQYSPGQIQQVEELILATTMPVNPRNRLQEIICDADLDYLGRVDYIPVAQNLYNELWERGMVGAREEWIDTQIRFIERHQFFTPTAVRTREENKQDQLAKLREWRREHSP